MFWKKKNEPIVQGQFSSIDKIFAIKKLKRCKEFVFEVFNWLKQGDDNIAFIRFDSEEANYVVLNVNLYKELINATIELKAAKDDIYYIKEIIKQLEDEEGN